VNIQQPTYDNNPQRLIRVQELKQFVGVGKSTIWRMTKEGRFPRPIRFGRSTLWRLGDVLAWRDSLSR
jgi:prophage regulatory protein